MKLQLALDRLSKVKCKEILSETEPYIDYIEIGTATIKDHGISIIREIKEIYPQKVVVADMKTCDSGKYETERAFEFGADITTVMGSSANKTIRDAVEVSKRYKKQLMVDLLGVNSKERIKEIQLLGVELINLHLGKDVQKSNNTRHNNRLLINDISDMNIAVAGGIDVWNINEVIKMDPKIIIVGSAITEAKYPSQMASKIKRLII